MAPASAPRPTAADSGRTRSAPRRWTALLRQARRRTARGPHDRRRSPPGRSPRLVSRVARRAQRSAFSTVLRAWASTGREEGARRARGGRRGTHIRCVRGAGRRSAHIRGSTAGRAARRGRRRGSCRPSRRRSRPWRAGPRAGRWRRCCRRSAGSTSRAAAWAEVIGDGEQRGVGARRRRGRRAGGGRSRGAGAGGRRRRSGRGRSAGCGRGRTRRGRRRGPSPRYL